MKQAVFRRFLALMLAAVLALGQIPAVRAGDGLRWEKSDVQVPLNRPAAPAAAESEPAPTDPVRVSIVLEEKSTLQAGFSTRAIAENVSAMAYNEELQAAQRTLAAQISTKVLGGKALDVVWNMTLAGNLISANVPYGKISAIEKLAGVKRVVIERQYELPETVEPQMSTAAPMTGAPTLWASGDTGAGSRIAIIDTGTDTDHQSFDNGAFLHALEENASAAGVSYEDYVSSLDLLDAAEIEAVLPRLNATTRIGAAAEDYYISEKLPFGANYVDKNLVVDHDHDAQGSHGSHVAGIAAANRYIPTADGYADAMEAAGMHGVAPDAQLLTLKVFGNAVGPYDSDYFAALEDAIWLGADAVNLSLGSASPGNAHSDDYESILEYLTTTDTVVAISGGNSGYWAENSASGNLYADDVSFATGGSPGSYHSALTVGSVDNGTDTISDFSSWGGPGDLSLKPEVLAPGGSIWSVDGENTSGTAYEWMSGTSMAAPQVTGMAALMAEYIRENDLAAQTSLSPRHLAQSLLMSTAQPLYADGSYCALMQQGAGLARVDLAAAADAYILVEGSSDGKVKAELGEDPDRTGVYRFRFTIHDLSGENHRYTLSADAFTQEILDGQYLGTGTRSLAALATFTADGVTMEGTDAPACDLNGDGVTDGADADYLLESLLGNETASAAEADVDGDGAVTSYDAHVLLKRLGGARVEVPAGGSVTVEVCLTLTDGARAELDEHYPSGAYVEAFVHAEPAEGGSAHSIPVLAFYGSWSDPGMFEVGSYLENTGGLMTRIPYLFRDIGCESNYLIMEDAAGNEYIFGGNPVTAEDIYLPERNAFNNKNGDQLYRYCATLIRNAAATRLVVENAVTGEIYLDNEYGSLDSAYYYPAFDVWQNTGYRLPINRDYAALAEGTEVKITVTAAPELYRVWDEAEGDYTADWDTLGDGCRISIGFTVDNTAPQVQDITLSGTTLQVTARDNRHVAAVAVLNAAGTQILTAEPANQTTADTQTTVSVDLSQVFGSEFVVAAYDYAGNASAYDVTLELETQRPRFTAINRSSLEFVGLEEDGTTVSLAPTPDGITFRAACCVGETVYAVCDDSVLYTGSDGDLSAMTRLGELDPAGSWQIGGFNDLAYNPADGMVYGLFYSGLNSMAAPYLCTISPAGAMEVLGEMPIDANSLAIDGSGNFYAGLYGSPNMYTFTADVVQTGKTTFVGSCGGNSTTQVNSMVWDHNTDELYWGRTANGKTYLYRIDPATAEVEYLCYYNMTAVGLYIPWQLPQTAAVTAVSARAAEDVTFPVTVPVDASNGILTVRYDPAQLALTGAAGNTEAFAWKDGAGTATLAFASAEVLTAGSAAAALTFSPLVNGTAEVTVSYEELNHGDTAPAETVALSLGQSCGDGLFWNFDNGVLTISGRGAMDDFDLTGPWYSVKDEIIRVVVEPGVTTIGADAFCCCYNLEQVTLPEGLTAIGQQAFEHCRSLKELAVPDTVTRLGDCAFFDCEVMTSLHLPAGLTEIPQGLLYGCAALTEVEIPAGVTTIGESAFNSCESLQALALPEPLTTIGRYAFKGCTALTAMTIPAAVTELGSNSFHNCGVTEITFLGDAPVFDDGRNSGFVGGVFNGITATAYYPYGNDTWTEDVRQDYTGTITWLPHSTAAVTASGWSGDTEWALTADGLLTVRGSGAMRNYTTKTEMPWYACRDQIEAVVLRPGVTRVGSYAFYGMPAMTHVYLPDTVTAIGDYAFKNSAALTSAALPAGLTQLGDSAFYACMSLTAVDIPASLWTVKPYTFKNCTALASVTFHEGNLMKISDGAFYNTALTEVVLPDCLDILDAFVFKNCTGLASVTLGSGITEIREATFYANAVPAITIPEGITRVGPYAFKSCTALEAVSLPESLTAVDESAFFGCTALTAVEIPAQVTTIGGYAFKRCTALAEVTLPEALNVLDESAFHTCTALRQLTIPAGTAKVGAYCFSASGLEEITFLGSAPAIGTGAFNRLTATAFYPAADDTWTADVRQNYGGTITWTAQ